MASEPLVSAVIPTYNNGPLVTEAVESALAQTYSNKEVIVVDDGSTDDTISRLNKFGSDITVIRQEHAGPPVARNAGIRASRGEFVAFLDSDDLWMPEKMARCLPPFERNPRVGVVYTAVRITEMESGLQYLLPQYTLSGNMARKLFLECHGVNTSTLMARRSLLDEVGMFDEELFRAQDWDLMIRMAEAADYAHVDEVLTERRLHSRSLSVTHANLYADYNLRVIRKALARRPDLYEDIGNDSLSRAHFRFGMGHYAEFHMAEARREFWKSLSCRWNAKALNYLIRAALPTALIRTLRAARLAGCNGDKQGGVEEETQ